MLKKLERIKARAPLHLNLKQYHNLFDRSSKLKIIAPEDFLKSKPTQSFWRVKVGESIFDIIKFTTPKRTRSFPMARMFEILSSPHKKVALVPIVKDEGAQADYLGFETVSIINTFGFYCILSYYDDAEIKVGKSTKITSQKLSFESIITDLTLIDSENYSTDKWNTKIIQNFETFLNLAKHGYDKIANKLGLNENDLRSIKNIDSHLKIIKEKGLDGYISWKNKNKLVSQYSELHTLQPKEDVISELKPIALDIYFSNDFGFKSPIVFHVAIDEFYMSKDRFWFIEKKKRSKARTDTKNNIIESIFRDILYSSLIFDENIEKEVKFAIGVTADEFVGVCYSYCPTFIECCENGFRKCLSPSLKKYNQKMDLINDIFFKNVLIHCHENKHLLFILGKNCLETTKKTMSIQKFILDSSN